MAILKKLFDDDGLPVGEGIEEKDDVGPTRQRVDRREVLGAFWTIPKYEELR
jgi:hypothetical protein